MKHRLAFNNISKILLLMVLVMVPFVWATPPKEIQLEYDQEKKVLHMDLKHVSSNPRKHYLRRVFIYKNSEEAIVRYYTKQTTPQGLTDDIAIDLSPGDKVRVLAVCSDAGRKEETLVIP